jgi:hypothetical protein
MTLFLWLQIVSNYLIEVFLQALDVKAMGSPVFTPRSHVMSPLMVPINGDVALSPQIEPRSYHL